MLAQFRDFLKSHTDRPLKASRYLLGVSGGLDSMVMFDLCRRLQLNCGVASVNYGLRPESAAEAELVEKTCRQADIKFHLLTPSMAERQGNLQEQARRFRLDFFQSLTKTNDYDWILLANHADDLVETMLIRQLQGRHPLLWGGFAPAQGSILRPLINIDRSRIRRWAEQHDVPWLEDSSNQGDDYLRNRIRHHLLPLMAEMVQERDLTRWQRNAHQLRRTRVILDELLELEASRCLLQKGSGRFVLDKERFRIYTSNLQSQLLFHLIQRLTDCSFAPGGQLLEQVLDNLRRRSGGMQIGENLRLRHNAEALLLVRIDRNLPEIPLQTTGRWQYLPGTGRVNCRRVSPAQVSFSSDLLMEYLYLPPDADCHYRLWRPGDSYVPLGRRQSRKVADLLSSRGILDREAAYVLECNGRIAWVVGQAIAHDFRVKDKDTVYKMRVTANEIS